MTEEWRPVIGFEGRYEVSNHGRVRSLTKNAPKHSFNDCGKEDCDLCADCGSAGILVLQLSNRGYFRVKLYKSNGKRAWRRVHRMVAESFIGLMPTSNYTVDHKDFNKRNNCVGNLEWVTREENYRRWLKHERGEDDSAAPF